MLGKTHLAFGLGLASCGIYLLETLHTHFSPQNLAFFYGAVGIGALLPDIDEPQSIIGKKTLGISNLIQFIFGHRGFTHSLCFILFLGILLFIFHLVWNLSLFIIAGLVLGCFLHLIGDMMTPSGVPLLMPFSFKNYNILPKALCFKTGGALDYLIGLISTMVFVYCSASTLQGYF